MEGVILKPQDEVLLIEWKNSNLKWCSSGCFNESIYAQLIDLPGDSMSLLLTDFTKLFLEEKFQNYKSIADYGKDIKLAIIQARKISEEKRVAVFGTRELLFIVIKALKDGIPRKYKIRTRLLPKKAHFDSCYFIKEKVQGQEYESFILKTLQKTAQ